MNCLARWWAVVVVVSMASTAAAQDWSQWRGDHRDAKAAAFDAPATWPKELAKKWQVAIGDGVATPSLVGDRLYVFSRQDGNEIARCLDAATGNEIWKDSYASEGTTGGASGFQGPRCSPTVAAGKVVTLGVRGILSCYDAVTGKVLWRKDDFPGKWPQFYTSSSPLIVDGLCIAQLGGSDDGGIVAYDLASGEEKWRWTGEGPSNGSPVVMEFGGTKVVIAPTDKSLIGVTAVDGKQVWKIQYEQGRGTSASPMVDGETLIVSGPGSGFTAIGLRLEGSELKEEELWKNTESTTRFNTPVLKDDTMYGLTTNNALFALNTGSHETAWTQPLGGAEPPRGGPFGPGGRGGGRDGGDGDRPRDEQRPAEDSASLRRAAVMRFVATTDGLLAQATEQPPAEGQAPAAEGGQPEGAGERRDGERRGRLGGRRRGGRGGGGGYGSIVDAGSVLLALTPASELVVYEPSDTEFKELARYKVAETPTYAYPVASGKRVFVKDQENVTLWAVE